MTEYVMIVVYAPPQHTEAVCRAMCDAGAGTVDDGYYDRVVYLSPAVCRYRILDRTRRGVQASGQNCEGQESRIEAICRCDRIAAVVQAICNAHPYETPAIAIYPTLTGEYKYWKEAAD